MIRKMSNKKTQGILMAAAMSFNLLNTVAIQMPKNFTADALLHNIKQNEAKPETYTAACCKALHFADGLFFGTAEAAKTQDVNSGENIDGGSVGDGQTYTIQNVHDGGTTTKENVENGGEQNLKGGTTVETEIKAGGVQNVSGGSSEKTSVYGELNITNGKVMDVKIYNGGVENVKGGLTKNGEIYAGGVQNVEGGTVENILISKGGIQNIKAGQAKGGCVFEGGVQNIQGGTADNVQVCKGGVQNFQSGFGNNIYVYDGGTQNIEGGTVTGTNIKIKGIQNITGGIADKTLVNGIQNIEGGKATNTQISKGGVQNVKSGEAAVNYINNGGTQNIEGGAAGDNIIYAGGVQEITAGTATNNTVYGIQNVNGGTAATNIVNAGGVQNVNDGTVLNTAIEENGSQVISGGVVSETTINGGSQTIHTGQVNGTVINEGSQVVLDGQVKGTTLKGGSQVISGGVVSETTINGGSQEVHAGQVSDTIINAGIATYQDGTIKTTTLNNGTANFQNGTIQDTTINAGTANFQSGNVQDTTINGGTTNLQGGSIQDTTINGGTTNLQGGNIQDTTVNGGVANLQGGSIDNTTIKDGSVNVENDKVAVKDVAISGGTLNIAQNNGNYTIGGTLDITGGTVNMMGGEAGAATATATNSTLTIENLKGKGGNIVIDADLNNLSNGSKVNIKNAESGAGGTIQIYDKNFSNGQALTESKKMLLVSDEKGTTDWSVKVLNDGGLWDVTPTIAKEGDDWYLTGETKEENAEVKTADSSINSNFATWKNSITNDTLRKRLGDLRLTGNAQQGIWTHVKAGKLNGSGYDGNFQTYNLGYDVKKGNAIYGAAVDYTRGTSNFKNGSGENNRVGLNLYATSYHPSGVYSDFIIRAGKIKNSMTNISGYNDRADWSNWGYSASYEQGKTFMHKNGWFFEPGAEITLGRLQGSNFTTDKGVSVNTGAMNVVIGRLGFAMGRRVNNNCDYYLKGNVYREFAGSGSIDLRAANGDSLHQDENHRDTWLELGLGGNVKLSKNTYLYGDVTKTFGADINTKWQVNAGLRFAF